jgi:hypothetical protein
MSFNLMPSGSGRRLQTSGSSSMDAFVAAFNSSSAEAAAAAVNMSAAERQGASLVLHLGNALAGHFLAADNAGDGIGHGYNASRLRALVLAAPEPVSSDSTTESGIQAALGPWLAELGSPRLFVLQGFQVRVNDAPVGAITAGSNAGTIAGVLLANIPSVAAQAPGAAASAPAQQPGWVSPLVAGLVIVGLLGLFAGVALYVMRSRRQRSARAAAVAARRAGSKTAARASLAAGNTSAANGVAPGGGATSDSDDGGLSATGSSGASGRLAGRRVVMNPLMTGAGSGGGASSAVFPGPGALPLPDAGGSARRQSMASVASAAVLLPGFVDGTAAPSGVSSSGGNGSGATNGATTDDGEVGAAVANARARLGFNPMRSVQAPGGGRASLASREGSAPAALHAAADDDAGLLPGAADPSAHLDGLTDDAQADGRGRGGQKKSFGQMQIGGALGGGLADGPSVTPFGLHKLPLSAAAGGALDSKAGPAAGAAAAAEALARRPVSSRTLTGSSAAAAAAAASCAPGYGTRTSSAASSSHLAAVDGNGRAAFGGQRAGRSTSRNSRPLSAAGVRLAAAAHATAAAAAYASGVEGAPMPRGGMPAMSSRELLPAPPARPGHISEL